MQPTRVLEIGSFVGLSTLSMAQVLPDDCEIVTLEIDPFAVDFGLDIKVQSDDFWKINHMVGPAWESLQSLTQQMKDAEGAWEPFDLAVIDADKAGMMEYFAILTEIPGFMSDNYVVCVDVKPFKGQLCTQKPDKNDSWLVSRGQTEIDEMRRHVTSSGKLVESLQKGVFYNGDQSVRSISKLLFEYLWERDLGCTAGGRSCCRIAEGSQ